MVLANVGMLVQPTTRQQFLVGSVTVPTNLFSHLISFFKIVQMQAANPNGSGGTGWAGGVADVVQPLNGASSFPVHFDGGVGAVLHRERGAIGQPDSRFRLSLDGMSVGPLPAAAKAQGLQDIIALNSGLTVVQAANKVRQDALTLNSLLKSECRNSAGDPVSANRYRPAVAAGRQHHPVAGFHRDESASVLLFAGDFLTPIPARLGRNGICSSN